MSQTSPWSPQPPALPSGPRRLSLWIRVAVIALAVLIPVLLALCDVYLARGAR